MSEPDPDALTEAVRSVEEARFSATGGDGRVTVTVSGVGTVLDVDIDPTLERHHLQRLGGWVEQAIADARLAARDGVVELTAGTPADPARLLEQAEAAVPWLARPAGATA